MSRFLRIAAGVAASAAVLAAAGLRDVSVADYAPDPSRATQSPCQEDEGLFVAPAPDPVSGLTWVCVTLDDIDPGLPERIDAHLAAEGAG